ncbi:hypothetical protein ACFT7S_37280 [Streptomyces sp. NPDC057136]|uniref:hypothetical protein n=1 Tax=Streptomyces sp. NPDC057136 TaxID=3346029 RepID=UPI0036368F23
MPGKFLGPAGATFLALVPDPFTGVWDFCRDDVAGNLAAGVLLAGATYAFKRVRSAWAGAVTAAPKQSGPRRSDPETPP